MTEMEELFNPRAQTESLSAEKNSMLEISYTGCPFHTIRECLIWNSKPIMKQFHCPRHIGNLITPVKRYVDAGRQILLVWRTS